MGRCLREGLDAVWGLILYRLKSVRWIVFTASLAEVVKKPLSEKNMSASTLDAGDEQTFQKINRPHTDLSFQMLVEGLCAFRREFTGQIWLEVFFVDGINTDIEHIDKIGAIIKRICPDRILLAMLKRRPCSLNDICSAMGLVHNEALKHLTALQRQAVIDTQEKNGILFFKIK